MIDELNSTIINVMLSSGVSLQRINSITEGASNSAIQDAGQVNGGFEAGEYVLMNWF